MIVALNPPLHSTTLIDAAVEWLQGGASIAMITLVNIEGNAPYPCGSQMLVNDQAQYVGQITGGCAEAAIADQAVAAIRQGNNITQRYGLDSPFFDIQLPCGSGIDVFIDVGCTLQELLQIQSQLADRQLAEQRLQTGQGEYVKRYLPQSRLILAGQGPILTSLAQLAQLTGFESLCLAQDETNIHSLQACGLHAQQLDDLCGGVSAWCDSFTGLVSLFHEHTQEIDLLGQALASELYYIGALGSRLTHQSRLETLRSRGFEEDDLSRIHGPVGLDIGASTPAGIAISILAQVVEYQPRVLS